MAGDPMWMQGDDVALGKDEEDTSEDDFWNAVDDAYDTLMEK